MRNCDTVVLLYSGICHLLWKSVHVKRWVMNNLHFLIFKLYSHSSLEENEETTFSEVRHVLTPPPTLWSLPSAVGASAGRFLNHFSKAWRSLLLLPTMRFLWPNGEEEGVVVIWCLRKHSSSLKFPVGWLGPLEMSPSPVHGQTSSVRSHVGVVSIVTQGNEKKKKGNTLKKEDIKKGIKGCSLFYYRGILPSRERQSILFSYFLQFTVFL